MNLKKHAAAKLGAIVASLFALATTLALVHRNPPASTAADTQAQPNATATAGRSTTSQPGSTQRNNPPSSNIQSSSAAAPKTHTRTHAS